MAAKKTVKKKSPQFKPVKLKAEPEVSAVGSTSPGPGEVEVKLNKARIKTSEVAPPAKLKNPDFFNEALVKRSKTEEGCNVTNGRHMLYKCPHRKFTIGYGRNIQERGISEQEAEYLLMNDIKDALRECAGLFPLFPEFSEARRNALVDMMLNMGLPTFLEFQHMIKAINKDEWNKAAVALMDSAYAKQLRHRAERNKKALQEG